MFEENEISKNAFGGTEIAKRKLAKIISPDLLENTQIICSRIRELQNDKIRIFWCHDLPEDPESSKLKDKEFRDQFHFFIFISNWQYQQYRTVLGFEYSNRCLVIESGFDPIEVDWSKKQVNEKINLIYTSTPQRGLEILYPVVDALSQHYPDIHLDVFSSFKIYGWEERDKSYQPLYDKISAHSNMSYHGFVDNETLKKTLVESHIFAYPCIWTETSCRAMLESMSAGVFCVHPNLGALFDTSGNLNFMYQADSDLNIHANIFYGVLASAYNKIKNNNEETVEYLKYVKNYTDFRFNINKIKFQWEDVLKNLNEKYPTVESRSVTKSKV